MSRTTKAFVLSDEDLTTLNQLVAKGKASVRKINRARILLLSHQKQTPQQVSILLNLSVATVYNIRNRYIQETLERSLTEKNRSGQPRKVTPSVEAQITSIACSEAPDGSVRWTTSLINDRLIKLDIHIHDESVRLVLKKANSSPGLKAMVYRADRWRIFS